MKPVLLLVLVLAITAVLVKIRTDARRARLCVAARLAEEADQKGVVSPTEELFRSAGIPVSEEMRAGLATEMAPSPPASGDENGPSTDAPAPFDGGVITATPPVEILMASAAAPPAGRSGPSDLASIFEGFEMPDILTPVTMLPGPGVNCAHASFRADGSNVSAVVAAMTFELARVGCHTTWTNGETADIARDGHRAVLRVAARADDGGIDVELNAA